MSAARLTLARGASRAPYLRGADDTRCCAPRPRRGRDDGGGAHRHCERADDGPSRGPAPAVAGPRPRAAAGAAEESGDRRRGRGHPPPRCSGRRRPGLAAGVRSGGFPGARAPEDTRGGTPKARGRRPLDPALPREVIRLPDPPSTARVDPFTGAVLVPGFTEVTGSASAAARGHYLVKRYERTVWVSATKCAPVTTPWPADVLSRSGVHTSVVAHIAAAHFVEHVPYHRLEQQLARTGVALPRSTQVSLMERLDTLVTPVVAAIRDLVLGSGYVHLDATPLALCDPARPGTTQSASVWTFRARSRDPALRRLGVVRFPVDEIADASSGRCSAEPAIAGWCRPMARPASMRSHRRSRSASRLLGARRGAVCRGRRRER